MLCPRLKKETMCNTRSTIVYTGLFSSVLLSFFLYSCTQSSGSMQPPGPVPVPVIVVDTVTATTYQEYPATLEGRVNVEIRAQVDGYLDEIYVDEGAFVKAGQPLFRINDLPYQEQLNNALASLHAAEANLYKAELELEKMRTLTKNNVVSDVQLKLAESGHEVAKANVEQSKAAVSLARINLGYTVIKAPVSGYIGRIPKRIGSLVGRADQQALTTLSDVSEVYAYFSMSEIDFISFNRDNEGNSVEEKIKHLLPVTLLLADGNTFGQEGKIEVVDGQFDKTTGSISVRATFPNPNGLLRSGNTGKVLVHRRHHAALLVPQEATMEIQDKIFVFAVGDSNKVSRQPVTVSGKSGTSYLVESGVAPGTRIVYSGLGNLQEGAAIQPQVVNTDSIH